MPREAGCSSRVIGSSGGSSANRWLIVAGAGLVILAFVARMLLDIGHTKVSDLVGVVRPDTTNPATAPAPAPAPAPADTIVTPPAAQPVATETQASTAPDTSPRPAPPASPTTPSRVAPAQSAAPQATSRPGADSLTGPKGTHAVVAKPPPVLRMDTTTPGSRYVVQIGAFGSEANAAKLGERASALGYQATVVPQVRGDATLYLVRVIRAGSAADARTVSDSLAKALGVTAVVLRPGQ